MSQIGPSADTPTEVAVQASDQTMTDHAAIQPTNLVAPADPAVGEDFDGLARQLFLGHPVPMWICDVETLRIVEVNDAAIDTYGYTRAEFLAKRVTDIRPAEDAERLRERIASIEPGSTRLQRPDEVWRHIYKDGSVHVVDVMSEAP